MNIINKVLKWAGLGMLCASLATSALASGAPTSFNFTNNISVVVATNANYPTTTNGFANGTAVAVFNQDHVGICFSGFLSNSTATTIQLTFVTSMAANNPTWNTTNYNDWSYNSNNISIAIPALTNWFNYQTNLQVTTVAGDAGWLGISCQTNGFAAGQSITNLSITVFKKIKPVSLIGN